MKKIEEGMNQINKIEAIRQQLKNELLALTIRIDLTEKDKKTVHQLYEKIFICVGSKSALQWAFDLPLDEEEERYGI